MLFKYITLRKVVSRKTKEGIKSVSLVSPLLSGIQYLLGDKNSRFLKSMLKIFKLALFKALQGAIEVDANFSDMIQ